MKKSLSLLLTLLTVFSTSLTAVDSTFLDYQNYNHGYCPSCNCYPCRCDPPNPEEAETETCDDSPCDPAPCDPNPCGDPEAPCASVCGTECGISLCAIAVGVIALTAAAVIIATSGSGGTGGDPAHAHS